MIVTLAFCLRRGPLDKIQGSRRWRITRRQGRMLHLPTRISDLGPTEPERKGYGHSDWRNSELRNRKGIGRDTPKRMNRPAADPPSLGSGFLVPISILLLCGPTKHCSDRNHKHHPSQSPD
jgi:hypothetical protein